MTEEELNERQRRRRALLLIPLLLLGAALCFWTLFASVSLGEAESFIPAPLGSDALANYGKDDIPGRLRSLSISIVEAVIRDRDPEEENVDSRVDDVVDSLKSPVPTVPGAATGTPTSPPTTTSMPMTGTVTATGSPSPSPFPSRTSTPTETDVPTAGPTSTSGPSPTPSKTPTPSNTPTPTPSNTPTPTPSNTPTPCKVIPEVWVHFPTEGQIYNPGSQIEGHAHAWDPDNVNPSDCSPTPEDGGNGIVEVEFRVKQFGVPEFIWTDLTQRYCAFGGSSPCNNVPVNGGIWPDSTPITGGVYEMYARAKDDEGQWSLWDYTTFTINLPTPTPTPSNTPTETPVPLTDTPVPPPTDTPVPSCPDFALSGNGDDDNNEVWWNLTNPGPVAAEIDRVELTWTSGGDLQRIKLGGSDIWNGSLSNPVDISSGWSGVGRLFDAPFPLSKELRFFFSNTVNNIYSVTVYSSNSCVISDSHDAD